MSQLRKLATAGGTFAVALGIGFVMQNGDALAARLGGDEAAAPSGAGVLSVPVVTPSASLAVPAATARGDARPFAALASVASPPLGMVLASWPAVVPSFGRTLMSNAPEAIDEVPVVAAITAPQPDMTEPDLPEPDLSVALAIPLAITAPVPSGAPVQLAAIETDDMLIDLPRLDETAPDCTVSFDGTPGPAATVDLTLIAACAPGAVATIHHQGMMFSVPLSAEGTARVTVPALVEGAVFIADIEGGDGAVAVVTVPDVGMYDRAVLQWQGDAGLQLHALEFGAGYADQGHLWNASLGSVDVAVQGEGGFMTHLGMAGGLVAEVYSYPTGYTARAGEVGLSVEIEVTEANCGQEIAAQTMQFRPGAEPTALDLEMTLPDCDAVGEFLVLNNMLEDLTLASR